MNTASRSDVRLIRNVEAPRPLKSSNAVQNVNTNTSSSSTDSSLDYVLKLMESVTCAIINHKFDDDLTSNIMLLHRGLKVYGNKLEDMTYQSELNDAFSVFRQCLVADDLEYQARVNLLEIIELRDRQWSIQDVISPYHTSRFLYNTENVDSMLQERMNISMPGNSGNSEKYLGKLSKSTGIVGKNYIKGDMIIRNSDSGKVQPTAKERQVQITGQTKDNIMYATQLIQDTIKSNTSPEPSISSSIIADDDNLKSCYYAGSELENNTVDDDKIRKTTEYIYRHKVIVDNNQILITGDDYILVTKAKSVLDDYFSKNNNFLQNDDAVFHDSIISSGMDDDNRRKKESYQENITTLQCYNKDTVDELNQLLSGTTFSNDHADNNNQILRTKSSDNAGIIYTLQDMLNLRDLPLSNDTPSNWTNIFRDYTNAPFIKQ